MAKKSSKRCGNCGSFAVVKKPTIGPFPWKDYPQIYLNTPVELHQCDVCGEHLGRAGEGAMIDRAIEQSIRSQARNFIETIIDRENCTQVDLAERVGVTPEFLSNVKNGTKLPGFQTFNFLKVLALDERAFKVASPSAKMIA